MLAASRPDGDLPGDGNFSNPDTADRSFTESNKWTEVRALLATFAREDGVYAGSSTWIVSARAA